MLFDLNMWKNQIFYYPSKYGQYIGIGNRVVTVTNQTILQSNDPSLWSYEARAQINPESGLPYINGKKLAPNNGKKRRIGNSHQRW